MRALTLPFAAAAPAAAVRSPAVAPPVARRRWVSPMMRRILLVNVMPLALLVATLLYLNQFQNSLLEAEVSALREQARIYAGALGQSAVAAGPHHDQRRARPARRATSSTASAPSMTCIRRPTCRPPRATGSCWWSSWPGRCCCA